jgi:hypothetical protein
VPELLNTSRTSVGVALRTPRAMCVVIVASWWVSVAKTARKGTVAQIIGDLTGLMKRLQMVGLIDPIVVTDNLTLIAGARLLEAMKRLGATMIEVRRVGDLSELEQRSIELHENSDRKDLTPVERSRIQVEPASAVASH